MVHALVIVRNNKLNNILFFPSTYLDISKIYKLDAPELHFRLIWVGIYELGFLAHVLTTIVV